MKLLKLIIFLLALVTVAHADIYPPVIWLLCAGYAYVVYNNFKLIRRNK